jgi:hypothetical protein
VSTAPFAVSVALVTVFSTVFTTGVVVSSTTGAGLGGGSGDEAGGCGGVAGSDVVCAPFGEVASVESVRPGLGALGDVGVSPAALGLSDVEVSPAPLALGGSAVSPDAARPAGCPFPAAGGVVARVPEVATGVIGTASRCPTASMIEPRARTWPGAMSAELSNGTSRAASRATLEGSGRERPTAADNGTGRTTASAHATRAERTRAGRFHRYVDAAVMDCGCRRFSNPDRRRLAGRRLLQKGDKSDRSYAARSSSSGGRTQAARRSSR